jgi:hypothetical protein
VSISGGGMVFIVLISMMCNESKLLSVYSPGLILIPPLVDWKRQYSSGI